jgi:hypothetical protein
LRRGDALFLVHFHHGLNGLCQERVVVPVVLLNHKFGFIIKGRLLFKRGLLPFVGLFGGMLPWGGVLLSFVVLLICLLAL